jgi:O-antigen/teichoic acid export membrane protein
LSATAASLTKLLAWRPGGYLRASGALFGWLAVRTLAQTVLFVLVARTLGADGYGSLIAVMALAGIFSFAGMGATAVMVREGSRQPERVPELTGDVLRLWLVSTPVLSVLAVLTNLLVLGDILPLPAILAIVIAEVACATAVDAIGRVYQSQDDVARMGLISGGLIIARLVAFATLMPLLDWTPASWAWGYCISSALYLGLLVVIVRQGLHRPRTSHKSIRKLASAALPFAFYNAAHKIHGEVNKPLLSRFDSTLSAGTFGAAHRFVDPVLLPALALVETLAPRAYRSPTPAAATIRLGLAPFLVALFGGALLAGLAGWIPTLIGETFAQTRLIVASLALLPAFTVVRILMGVIMTAQNLQRHFFFIHGAGATISTCLTAVLVIYFEAAGAIVAAYLSEASLIAIQGFYILRRERIDISARDIAPRGRPSTPPGPLDEGAP